MAQGKLISYPWGVVADSETQVLKIWFGDYLFRPSFSDVRQDFETLGGQLGFSICSSREAPDAICLVNFFLKDVLSLILQPELRKVRRRMHLVTEPSVTLPALQWTLLWKLLDLKRVTLGAGQLGKRSEKPHRCVSITTDLPRRQRAALVNGNKFSWMSGELYSLRRRLIAVEGNLDVFGSNWELSRIGRVKTNSLELLRALATPSRLRFGARDAFLRPPNLMGTVEDKLEALAGYKVCVVIENSFELVTEKLIDAWMAGCIPVYVGPNLQNINIPNGTYVYAEPSVGSIQAAINKALEMNWEEFNQSLQVWLSSTRFTERWSYEAAWSGALSPILHESS